MAAILFALAASPAEAVETIAGWGHGAGKVNNPVGVAVDQSTGDFYVADRNNGRVDRFDSEGDFLLAWGAGVADGKGPGLQVCGPAAEPPTKRCFAGLHIGDEAVVPLTVAVELTTHDVYVAEPRRISRFASTGQFLFTLGKDVNKTKVAEGGATQAERDICTAAGGDTCGEGKSGTGPGEFEASFSLAFDGEGKLWVNDNGKRAQRFDSAGGFLEEVPLPAGTQISSALAIDPTTDDFYVLGPRGDNERQHISRAESGEFTLGFEGETTEGLASSTPEGNPHDAEEIQKALEALPAIGEGNVSVERFGPFDYSVVFIRDLGGRDVPQLSASGGSPPVTVTTETQGTPGSVRKLDSGGALLETLDDEPGDIPRALATDAAGNLYVGDGGFPYHLLRYDSAGNLTSLFGAGQVLGGDIFGNGPTGNAIALDEAGGSLYTASSYNAEDGDPAAVKAQVAVQRFDLPGPGPLPSEPRADDLLPSTATLAATLIAEGHETTYRFQYVTEAAYEADKEAGGDGFEGPATEETAEAVLPGSEYEEEEVSAEIKALTPATQYRFRILAANSEGESEARAAFTTRTAVGIESQWASDLSAHDATLNALLDPFGAAGAWWVEYDTAPYAEGEPGHGTRAPVPGSSLPASFGELPVAVALRDLQASTAYHYRFVAEDEREVREGGGTVTRPFTTYGPDRSFTTQPAGLGFVLPDARAWEMVSPPDKHGGRIAGFDQTGGQVQAAANGEALAYLSYGSLEANPEGNRIIEQSSELARRGGEGAWSTTDITPPHTEASPIRVSSGLEYKLFSTNLESVLLDPHAPVQLSPFASEDTPYLRENTNPPDYTPLVVGCPPEGEPCPPAVKEHENVPAGTVFGGALQVRGATPDLRHVVLLSTAPLAEGAAEGGLYEWSGGALQALSVPPGKDDVLAADLGSGETSTRGAVSEDGSRVFWTSPGLGGGLYLRDTAREETVRLDQVQPGAFGTGQVAPSFQAADADGSVAFFTDTRNLTEDANEEGTDLYRWQAEGSGGCEEPGGCLTDLSAGVVDPGESAEVQGILPGVAEDGSVAYFVARGVLDEGSNAEGESATPGQPNLYAWREGEGVRFVATLSEEDSTDWGLSRAGGTTWSLTAAPSPAGRYLAFMSELPLTGYDNRATGGGERAQEVFRYDALAEELTCVSCNPSGARPRARVAGGERRSEEELLDPQQLLGQPGLGWLHTVAALVPEASKLEAFHGYVTAYRPRYVQDDGRVFFNAVDSLVPADSNGAADVYEFEPTGTGSCTASAGDSGSAAVPGGCVSLISSGTAEGTSAFLDASEGARDVFFYSPARLSVGDEDGELDVYDAREGGEPATLEPSAECLGEACQPPAVPPVSRTPASASFRGPGNPPAAKPRRSCPKGRHMVSRRGKARCVKRGQASKHRRRHSKHRNNGRSR